MSMNEQLVKRLKSLAWRAGGMAFVAAAAYITNLGDVFAIDPHQLVNVAILAFLGLVTGEITKLLNQA